MKINFYFGSSPAELYCVLFCVLFIHVACLWMCVLFYYSLFAYLCMRMTSKFKSKVYCRSAQARARHFRATLLLRNTLCFPDVMRGLAMWLHNKPKTKNQSQGYLKARETEWLNEKGCRPFTIVGAAPLACSWKKFGILLIPQNRFN